jgi:hypothetical protein
VENHGVSGCVPDVEPVVGGIPSSHWLINESLDLPTRSFEIANVLVCLDHVAIIIAHANRKILPFTSSSPSSQCSEKT